LALPPFGVQALNDAGLAYLARAFVGYGSERVVRVSRLLASGFVPEHRFLIAKAGSLF